MIIQAVNCYLAAGGLPAGPYGSHRYWRLYITTNCGNAATTVAELEFLNGGVDQTGSGTAMSGGSGSDTQAASRAFDNSGATEWARSATGTCWLGYDFGSPVGIDQMSIQTLPNSLGQSSAPSVFALEYSDDASSWTAAESFSLNTSSWLAGAVRPFPETLTAGFHRYWRLFCVDNNGGSSLIGIGEIEFRATPGGADQSVALGSNAGGATGRVIGSSISTGGGEGFLAFDGSSGSWWAASGTTNQWVAFIFPNPVTVTQAMLQALNGTGTNNSRQVKNGKIEWSDDGLNWTTAATFTKTWTINEQITVAVTP